jgi:competence protein ComEA
VANAAALGAVVLVVAALSVWWVVASRPHPIPVTGSGVLAAGSPSAASGSPSAVAGSVGSSAPGSDAATTGEPALLVVDVAGLVAHPGIYRLPAGSRVYDALVAAGGAMAGTSTTPLNLAAPLADGQQVVVGVAGVTGQVAPNAAGVSGGAASPGSTLVSLNAASLEQLEALPGVGPVLAQHILDWRSQHGRFARVDQLRDVSGIGPAKFAAIKARVTV